MLQVGIHQHDGIALAGQGRGKDIDDVIGSEARCPEIEAILADAGAPALHLLDHPQHG